MTSTLRKILTTGVGAALMTEEGLRNTLADMKLTQQAKDYFTRQVLKGREEITKRILSEIQRFLEHINLHDELLKVLSDLKIQVDATVTLVPKDSKKSSNRVAIRKFRIKS